MVICVDKLRMLITFYIIWLFAGVEPIPARMRPARSRRRAPGASGSGRQYAEEDGK